MKSCVGRRWSSRQTADGSLRLVGIRADQGLGSICSKHYQHVWLQRVCVRRKTNGARERSPSLDSGDSERRIWTFFFFCLKLFILINGERHPAPRAAENKNGQVPNVVMCEEGEDKTARQNVWDAVDHQDLTQTIPSLVHFSFFSKRAVIFLVALH